MGIGIAKVPSSWPLVSYLHLIGLQEDLVLLMAEIIMCKQHRHVEVKTGKNVVIQGRHTGIFQGKRCRNFEVVVHYVIRVTLRFIYAAVDSWMLCILLVRTVVCYFAVFQDYSCADYVLYTFSTGMDLRVISDL
jgi:hypothetical protein